MKKVGLLRDTRLGVCSWRERERERERQKPGYINFRVYAVEFIGALSTCLPSRPSLPAPSLNAKPLSRTVRSWARWMCNVFDLMHSRNKLYCRVACVAATVSSLVRAPASSNGTDACAAIRRGWAPRSALVLAGTCEPVLSRCCARQWKWPFVVVLSPSLSLYRYLSVSLIVSA